MEFSKAYYRSLAVQHIGCEKPRAYFIPFADLPDSITVPSNWQMPLGKGYDVSCGLYHRSVTLTAELTMASLARMACLWMTVTYTVTGSGALTVDTHVKVTDREGFPYLPRLGMRTSVGSVSARAIPTKTSVLPPARASLPLPSATATSIPSSLRRAATTTAPRWPRSPL